MNFHRVSSYLKTFRKMSVLGDKIRSRFDYTHSFHCGHDLSFLQGQYGYFWSALHTDAKGESTVDKVHRGSDRDA
jgi:hypothetical protein